MMYFGFSFILILILGLSIYSSSKQKGKAFSGRKSVSGALVLGGIVGTLVGGSSTIGTAQAAYTSGFSAWWYTLGCSIGIIIFDLVFSKRIYFSGKNTLLEIVSSRYGETSGRIMSLLSAGGTVLSMVSQVISGVALLMTLMPVGKAPAITLFIILVMAYVFFGGGISLGYMGILKTVLMALGFGLCGLVSFHEMGSSLFSLPYDPYFNIFSGGVWKNLSQVISLAAGIITGQNYSSALITGKTYTESRKAILISSLIGPFIGIFCIASGYYMSLTHPGLDSATVLPLFIQLKMPRFIAGCLSGMLLLTLVGTTSGTLYATSTIIYRGLLRNKFHDETFATRSIIIALIFIVTFIVLSDTGALIITWTFLGAGLRGAVSLFPLILALFVKKTVKKGYMLSSMVAAPVCTILGKLLLPSIDILPIFWGLLGSLFFIVLGLVLKGE